MMGSDVTLDTVADQGHDSIMYPQVSLRCDGISVHCGVCVNYCNPTAVGKPFELGP